MPVSIPNLPAAPEAPIGANQAPSPLPQSQNEGSQPSQDFGAMLSEQEPGTAGVKARATQAQAALSDAPVSALAQASSGFLIAAEDGIKSTLLSSSKAPAGGTPKVLKTTPGNVPEKKAATTVPSDPMVMTSPLVPLPEVPILVAAGNTVSKGTLGEASREASELSTQALPSHVPPKVAVKAPVAAQEAATDVEMAADPNPRAEAAGVVPVWSEAAAVRAPQTPGEKIAAEPSRAESGVDADALKGNKTLLSIGREPVTSSSKSVGTGVANSSATMNNEAFNQSTAVTPADGVSALSSRLPGRDPGADDLYASSASAAVESALQVGDIQAAATQGSQSSVNLRFNIAGEDLSVKVALQAGQLHTQFSTASGDLRSALAHEWQAAVPATTEQSRFAEPVFTGGSRTFSDPGQEGRQQSGQNRGDADESSGTWGARTAPASAGEPVEASEAAPNTALAGHLQSFA